MALLLTDGFSILHIFANFLYWFHIYQQKALDCVILLMRFVRATTACNYYYCPFVSFHQCQFEDQFLLFIMLQVALVALATNPSFHKDLLSTVKTWPPVIYSALPVISTIEPQLNTSSMTEALKEVSQGQLSYAI